MSQLWGLKCEPMKSRNNLSQSGKRKPSARSLLYILFKKNMIRWSADDSVDIVIMAIFSITCSLSLEMKLNLSSNSRVEQQDKTLSLKPEREPLYQCCNNQRPACLQCHPSIKWFFKLIIAEFEEHFNSHRLFLASFHAINSLSALYSTWMSLSSSIWIWDASQIPAFQSMYKCSTNVYSLQRFLYLQVQRWFIMGWSHLAVTKWLVSLLQRYKGRFKQWLCWYIYVILISKSIMTKVKPRSYHLLQTCNMMTTIFEPEI